MQEEELTNYEVDDKQFTESQKGGFDDSAIFYESAHSMVFDKKTKNTYYKVELPKNNKYNIPERYKNFLYIVGNNPPFGKFKGYSQDYDNFYVYLQYDPQKTLQNILEGGFDDIFDDTVKSKTVIAVAAALEYCHALEVSCRFIHPESIFYDKDKDPYIVNLGYSETILNSPNILFNTKITNTEAPIFQNNASYLAPELLNNPNSFSYKSDVYSFGSLLYKLITGEDLFKSNNKNEVLDLITHNHYPKIDQDKCSKILIEIIEKCHSANPNERYTSSEILEKLLSTDAPLFPECDMDIYNNYKEKILAYIYYNKKFSEEDSNLHPRCFFAVGSRLYNAKSHLEDIAMTDKKNIFKLFRLAARSNFSPACYRYALLLDSNIESFMIEKSKYIDSFHFMGLAVTYGVYNAPLKLGEMYDRRGYHDLAAKIYLNLKEKNGFCLIKYMITAKPPLSEYEIKSNIKSLKKNLDPEVRFEAELFELTYLIKNGMTQVKHNQFFGKMNKLAKKTNNGKIFYYLAMIYKYCEIPESVERGINGYLSIKYDDENEEDNTSLFDMLGTSLYEVDEPIIKLEVDIKAYEENLKLSAERLYEPAVAEYVAILLNKYKKNQATSTNYLSKATDLLNNFFNTYGCINDRSRTRIQHARAMLLEIKGKESENKDMVKEALKIYKEAADGGLAAGIADYLRLYCEGEDQTQALINFYKMKLEKFNPISK